MEPAAERLAWCFAVFFAFLLLGSYCGSTEGRELRERETTDRPCNEMYVVGEGETLHSISAKCSDPFIVEENPHIQDDADVYPGLVIKITPFRSK